MIKNLPTPKQLRKKPTLAMILSAWCFDSHYWIEDHPGYFHCQWCDSHWTNEMPLTNQYTNLCLRNPIVQKAFSNKK